MAAEHVGCPKRRLAVGEALRQELDLRLEVSLGIPRDGDAARKPWPADHQRGKKQQQQCKAGFVLKAACALKGLGVPPRRRNQREVGFSRMHALTCTSNREGRWGLLSASPLPAYNARVGQSAGPRPSRMIGRWPHPAWPGGQRRLAA